MSILVAIYYWYSPDAPKYWLWLFNCYPPFNFAKTCADFILLAYPSFSFGSHTFDVAEGNYSIQINFLLFIL